jgi:hypothetical protein
MAKIELQQCSNDVCFYIVVLYFVLYFLCVNSHNVYFRETSEFNKPGT